MTLHLVLIPTFRCCFAGSLQFSSSTAKQTKLYHSNFRDVFHIFYEKNTSRKPSSLNVCEVALQAASAYKRREFWREIPTSFASDWTYNFFSFLFFFFHVSKPSFVFAYENLRHSSLVSISQHVCLILLLRTVHVVYQIVSCISGYG